MFELTKHPIIFRQPADLDVAVPGWIAHIPFAFLLVDLLQPKKIVELGVHSGNSFQAFCEAVQVLGLDTQCFGVDTWTGDPQAGYYGESVYKKLQQNQEDSYGSFSYLLRMRFEEAVAHFEDGSIDLLHIDGLHTYEAVKKDFETWLPKLSSTGVVLMHDTHVRKDDFGVWRFWGEISRKYSSFSFEFSSGLGVLLIGDRCPEALVNFAQTIGQNPEFRSFFFQLGKLAHTRAITDGKNRLQYTDQAQLFYDTGQGWTEDNVRSVPVFAGEQHLHFLVPKTAHHKKLRFDPAAGACVLAIHRIIVNHQALAPSAYGSHNAQFQQGPFFVFTGEDPKIEILLPEDLGQVEEIEFDIQYLTFDKAGVRALVKLSNDTEELVRGIERQVEEKDLKLAEQVAALAHLKEYNQGIERQIEEKDLKLAAQATALAHLKEYNQEIRLEIEEKDADLNQQKTLLTQLRQHNQELTVQQVALSEKQETRIKTLQAEITTLSKELSLRNDVLLRTREKTIALSQSFQSVIRKKEEVLASLIEDMKQERDQFREDLLDKSTEIKELRTTVKAIETAKQTINGAKEAVEADNLEKQRAISGLEHQLRSEREVLAAFSEDNERLRGATGALRRSWSFRLGWILTWPLRIIYELFFGGKLREHIRVLSGLAALVLKSPLAFLRHFRPGKIGVLFRALRNEPPQRILDNFRLFLKDGGQKPVAELALPVPKPVVPADLADFSGPLISVVIPVYNTPEQFLVACIRSVLDQYYTNWELIIIDDCSTDIRVRETLDSLTLDGIKARVIYAPENLNIAEITNRGIEATTGDFIALLDHDDLLMPDALLEMAKYIDRHPEVDAVYSDQDKIDEQDQQYEPFFKPDWSPWFFRAVMYVGHLLVFRKSIWHTVGKFSSEFNGIQDYEFMLRLSESTDRIGHLPKILYHWRAIAGSIAADENSKGQLAGLQAKAVNDHLQRLGIPVSAEPSNIPHRLRIVPAERSDFPKVSIIIPTKNAPDLIGQCLESIYGKSTYPNFEVILVDNQTSDPAALRIYDQYPVRIIPYHEAFNYSRANNLGVEQAEGDYLLFLNNDVELLTPSWIEEFLLYAEQENIGAVGPMLTFPNGAVQHAGVVLGFRGTADHVMRNFPAEVDGYFGSLSCVREVSALTAACMMMRKALFEELGGFNEVYAQIYQDVDLCLKIRERDLSLIYNPNVRLIHYESATRDASKYDFLDRVLLLDQWQETIERGDPYYNPNFNIAVYTETESGYHL